MKLCKDVNVYANEHEAAMLNKGMTLTKANTQKSDKNVIKQLTDQLLLDE